MENGELIACKALQQSREAVLEMLYALQDMTYQAFQSKLMPTISPETIIGVRIFATSDDVAALVTIGTYGFQTYGFRITIPFFIVGASESCI